MRHGVATSLLANLHRDRRATPTPYKSSDFTPWRDAGPVEEVAPVLLDDPVAQANLIRAALFGLAPV